MPPSAPPSRRSIRFSIGQAVGIGLLATLPILAVFDRFGTRETVASASNDVVGLTVEYSPRVRYGLPTQMKIEVRASRGAAAGPIAVRVETGFIDRFAQLSALPAPAEIDARHHTFVLPASDSQGVILIDVEPEHPGRAHGRVTAAPVNGGSEVEVDLDVFAFP